MQQYSYKNSGIEWLGEIPEHWKVDRIKDKTTAVVGGDWGNDPDSEAEGENVVVLRVADLDDIYFKFEDLTIRKIKNGSFKSRKVDERCLIIEKSGGGEKQLVGRVGYPIGIDFNAICSNFMAKIEFDNSMDLRFANYIFSFLYSCNLNFPFVQQTTGIQNLNVTYYLNSKVAFPPLPEQKAIADYLDKACARIDRIIAIKEEQLRKIEGYFFSRLDEILTCKNNNASGSQKFDQFIRREIPKEWNIDRLRDIVIINDLALSNNTPNDFIINYLDISNVNKYGIVDKSEIRELTFEEAPSRARRVTRMNDTVISSVRTNLQAVAYIDFELSNFTSSTGFFVCRPKFPSILKPKFLYFFLLSTYSKDFFFSHSTGVSYPAINDYKFGSISIFYPSPKKQEEIIIQLESLRLKVNEMIKKTESQITTLQSYRKSLIHECVTGKKQVYTGVLKTKKEVHV